MSSLAVPVDGAYMGADELAQPIRDRINAGLADRKKYEPTWQMNRAFASGQHHLQVDRMNRTLYLPDDAKKLDSKGQLYSVDIINERRQRVLGEYAGDDWMPELLLVDSGASQTAEDFQQQVNRAVAFGWDHEWSADSVLSSLWQHVIDDGTAAIQCSFDPTVGKVKQEQVPFYQGQPVQDLEQAHELFANGPRDDVEMRTVKEGKITWRLLGAPNLIVPPGVTHEDGFPWVTVVRPVLLDKLKEEYGEIADDVKEDSNIASTSVLAMQGTDNAQGRAAGKLRGHAWLYLYYENPTRKNPNGRVVHLAGGNMKPVKFEDQLPYQGPDETYRNGIYFFHWWRVTGRFWGRSLVEPMTSIQRGYNKRNTQIDQIIDRGMPYVIGEKGNMPKRIGLAMEVLPIADGSRPPQPVPGINPGGWMFQDLEQKIHDLDRASNVGQSALGENPENAQTYGQLALLHEQESGKRTATRKEHQAGVRCLVEDSVYDMRKWWGPEKQILIDDDPDKVQGEIFNATKIPPFFIVRAAKGSAKPRSQAAEIQKIDAIWKAAIDSGAVMMDPHRWVDWYRDSLEAGQTLKLPEVPSDEHEHKADIENGLLTEGQQLTAVYYDPPEIHIPRHRQAQVEAELAGNAQGRDVIEMHVQQHLEFAKQAAEQQAAMEQQQNDAMQAQELDHQKQLETAKAEAQQKAAPRSQGGKK